MGRKPFLVRKILSKQRNFNLISSEQQALDCLLFGKGRVKESVEQRVMHPKVYLLQVNGVRAISHTPDRDRVLPIAPEGRSERKGGRQCERKGDKVTDDSSRKETKNGSINHRHENMDIKDNGELGGYRMMDTKSTFANLNACS